MNYFTGYKNITINRLHQLKPFSNCFLEFEANLNKGFFSMLIIVPTTKVYCTLGARTPLSVKKLAQKVMNHPSMYRPINIVPPRMSLLTKSCSPRGGLWMYLIVIHPSHLNLFLVTNIFNYVCFFLWVKAFMLNPRMENAWLWAYDMFFSTAGTVKGRNCAVLHIYC